ncbi:MAG: dockerin type I domain-containing protein [Myxococcota bacterium]
MRKLLSGGLFAAALFYGFTASAANSCQTDLNGDGVTNEADVKILQSSLGKSQGDEGYVAAADLDGSGSVTTADYGIFLSCN